MEGEDEEDLAEKHEERQAEQKLGGGTISGGTAEQTGEGSQHDTAIDLGLPSRRGMLQKESVYLKWWRLRYFILDPIERSIRVYVDETMAVHKGVINLADIIGNNTSR